MKLTRSIIVGAFALLAVGCDIIITGPSKGYNNNNKYCKYELPGKMGPIILDNGAWGEGLSWPGYHDPAAPAGGGRAPDIKVVCIQVDCASPCTVFGEETIKGHVTSAGHYQVNLVPNPANPNGCWDTCNGFLAVED